MDAIGRNNNAVLDCVAFNDMISPEIGVLGSSHAASISVNLSTDAVPTACLLAAIEHLPIKVEVTLDVVIDNAECQRLGRFERQVQPQHLS